MLDFLATHPSIATQDSGVSWGALLGILGGVTPVGMTVAGMAFNFLKGTLAELKREILKLREDLTNLVTRLEDKVDKVEGDSRSARTNLWQEHRRLERDHDKAITELETQMRLSKRETH